MLQDNAGSDLAVGKQASKMGLHTLLLRRGGHGGSQRCYTQAVEEEGPQATPAWHQAWEWPPTSQQLGLDLAGGREVRLPQQPARSSTEGLRSPPQKGQGHGGHVRYVEGLATPVPGPRPLRVQKLTSLTSVRGTL